MDLNGSFCRDHASTLVVSARHPVNFDMTLEMQHRSAMGPISRGPLVRLLYEFYLSWYSEKFLEVHRDRVHEEACL